ncbi:MAG: DUF1549 domain-containing protein, partial [Verrucomicrobiales bacterium]
MATTQKRPVASWLAALAIPLSIAPSSFFALQASQDKPAAEIGFNDQIRPILSENCFKCHGPDSAAREADLRLDTRAGALAEGAIVPGDPRASEVVARITTTDPDDLMPPPDSHKKLKPAEKELLAKWIENGAQWEQHWSFIAPRRPAVPKAGANWAHNDIDAFISARFRALDLAPNAQADRHTLARRAAFDITGLPPAPEAIAKFVSDRAPDAYERYVDRLLASPHYGEHRARFWLDAARYGDTHGLHLDNYREMWPYRDWVIRSFNDNLPFDQFTRQQIAGDLMPKATASQRIATGFNRCNVSSSEGGSIPEELAVRYMIDRVATTSTVFLGLTTGCAVCHDHKFDPISQKDFYRLAAYFNNVADPAMDGNQKDTPPVVVLPEGEMATEWNRLMKRRAQLRAAMKKHLSQISKTSAIGEHPVAADDLRLWMPLNETTGDSLAVWIDGKRHQIKRPDTVAFAKNSPTGDGIIFEENGPISIPGTGIFDPDAAFTISLWIKTPDIVSASSLFEQLVPDSKDPKKFTGYKLIQDVQGGSQFEWHGGGEEELVRVILPSDQALTPKKWQHFAVRYSGSRAESGLRFLVNGVQRSLRPGTEDLIDFEITAETPLLLGKTFRTGGMSALRIFERWLTDEEVRVLANEPALRRPGAPESLRRLHQAVARDETYRRLSRQLATTQTRRDFIALRSPTTMVMQDRHNVEPAAYVLERGEYDRRGETVRPGVPAVLPPLPPGAPANRLGLAQWLTMPDHPLTARVTVNRLWQQMFGTGLVRTAEDFGVMGERPSHPELLDWLALEFIESGWDVKHMIRLMVTSSTYRQAARITPAKLALDPDNRTLSRGARRCLDAEALRDQ